MTDFKIEIRLPLPLDIAGTLTNLIGTCYPSARIATNSADLTILISNTDRKRKVNKRTAAAAKISTDDPTAEGFISAIHDDGATIGLPEVASRNLAGWCATWLESYPDANYLETTATDPETGRRYVIIACNSPAQTPHALRQAAEDKLTAVRAELLEVCDGQVLDAYPAIHDLLEGATHDYVK